MLNGKEYADISDYPELKMPDIKAQIPEELMEDLNPKDKHLFTEISKQTQMLDWCAHALIDTNRQVRITNGRVKKVEQWKNMLTNSWSMGVLFMIILSTIATIASKLFEIAT